MGTSVILYWNYLIFKHRMYKNQYSQNRPSSVSSAQTKNYFYSNTTSRLAFQPSLHTQSPQKLFPFHKVDSTMIQREVNNPKKELLINNASIGNSRVQT